jgi:hypothetical protein
MTVDYDTFLKILNRPDGWKPAGTAGESCFPSRPYSADEVEVDAARSNAVLVIQAFSSGECVRIWTPGNGAEEGQGISGTNIKLMNRRIHQRISSIR